MSRFDQRTLPPSIADQRERAFAAAFAKALDEPEFKRFLFERIDSVSDAVLPALIREFSIEEFVEPGMTPTVIRRLLKGAYEIHAQKGFIPGVRLGLSLLGVDVVSWIQWFQRQPAGAPGTHRVRLRLTDELFEAEGLALTSRVQRAVLRMIAGMQRWSQDIDAGFSFDVSAPTRIGVVAVSRITVRAVIEPIRRIGASAPTAIGVVALTRVKIRTMVTA